MSTVRHFLRSRPASHKVHVLSPQHTAWDALEIMSEYNIGALPVIEDGRLVGFFSERDYTRKVELKGRTAATTPIHEIMVRKVITGSLVYKIEDCMRIMSENHIRHLPIVEGGKIVGMVTIRDVIRVLLQEKDLLIRDLEGYIAGGGYASA